MRWSGRELTSSERSRRFTTAPPRRSREINAAPAEGDLTIIPLVEVIVIVEKRLVLEEEIHLRRTVTREDVEVPVQLRKQQAVIENDADEEAESK